MPQRNSVTLIAVALTGLLPLSPVVAGRARPQHHAVSVDKELHYPKMWPKGIPVLVGDAACYPLATRARLDTFGKLQLYCQQHEGTWPLYQRRKS